MSTRRGFGVVFIGIGGLLQLAGIIGIIMARGDWKVMILLALVAGAGAYLLMIGKMMRQLTGEELLREDKRSPVLLLRSFARDHIAYPDYNEIRFKDHFGVEPGLKSINRELKKNIGFEELVARHVKSLGPFIAIGRPGELLPAVGASRFYETNETWRDRVSEFVEKSSAIIIILDQTPGLMWEMSHLTDVRIRRKTLLLSVATPEKAKRQETFSEWERLMAEHAGVRVYLDEKVVGVYFDQSGIPVVLHSEACDIAERLNQMDSFISYRKENAEDPPEACQVSGDFLEARQIESSGSTWLRYLKSVEVLPLLIFAALIALWFFWQSAEQSEEEWEDEFHSTTVEEPESFSDEMLPESGHDGSDSTAQAKSYVEPADTEAERMLEQLRYLSELPEDELEAEIIRRLERADPRMKDPVYRAAFEQGRRDAQRVRHPDPPP